MTRASGIDLLRITELSVGYPIRESEAAALATAYGVQPSDIIASLPDPELLLRGE